MKLGLVRLAVALALVAPARAEDRPLKIGLSAMISPKETLSYYTGLLAWVGQRLDRKVEMVQYATYAEMDGALERRDLEIAFLCSGPYVRDRARFGVEPIAAPQVRGKALYHAHLIVPEASPARTLADLRGRSFAFTDPLSNTGRTVPAYLVEREFGVHPEDFFSALTFSGSHDRSITLVARGAVDGASVDSLVYDYLAARQPAKVRGTRILATSPPYGIPPIVVHPLIDPALRLRLRAALLSMHEDPRGKAILDAIQIDRFVVPRDEDYDSVRELERWLDHQPPPAPAPRSAPAPPAAARR